jgi:hypothetical protein
MWKYSLYLPIIQRHLSHEQRIQVGNQVNSVAWNQKVLSFSCSLCMEKRRQGGNKWNCLILQHSVCPKAVQLVRLIEIGWAARVMKWAVYWTDSVGAEREVATPLVPGRRSDIFVLRPSSKQKRNNCTVFLCFTVHMSVATVCGTVFGVRCFTFCHTMCLYVLCGSENKQRLFHCTALTGWFL